MKTKQAPLDLMIGWLARQLGFGSLTRITDNPYLGTHYRGSYKDLDVVILPEPPEIHDGQRGHFAEWLQQRAGRQVWIVSEASPTKRILHVRVYGSPMHLRDGRAQKEFFHHVPHEETKRSRPWKGNELVRSVLPPHLKRRRAR